MWLHLGLALYNLALGYGACHLARKMKKKGNVLWTRIWYGFSIFNVVVIVYELLKAFNLIP